tara:strand:+ start:94671 stop:95867 length:1197 start_codon:yes stop_codon:yes gene_type:complete
MTNKNPYMILLMAFLVITIGQFACAVYLPSLPAMQQALATDPLHAQWTYTFILIAYGGSMFIYGPLSDRFGRKHILLTGMCVFLVGSVITLFAQDITIMLFARVVQGLGLGSAGLARAISKDTFDGKAFIKASAYMSMGVAVTPIIAQVIGGYIETLVGWRGNFVFMLVYAAIIIVCLFFILPETNRHSSEKKFSAKNMAQDYVFILNNKAYIGLMICLVLAFAGEMLYTVIAPFLLQGQLHITPEMYGWLSVVIIGGYALGSFISSRLADKYNVEVLIMLGLSLLLTGSVLMLALSAWLNTYVIIIPMAIYMVGNSMALTNAGAAGMMLYPKHAGTAGALQSGLMLMGSGIVSSAASDFHVNSQLPLAFALTVLTLAAIVAFYFLVWKNPLCQLREQ